MLRSFCAAVVSIMCTYPILSLGMELKKGTTATHERPAAIEADLLRQGNYIVKQLIAPGFEKLPLDRKLYAYYLTRAIDAGRDIVWGQMNKDALKLRGLLEEMWRNSETFSPMKKTAFAEYFYRVLANHCNFERRSNRKFVPEFLSRQDFADLATQASFSARKKGNYTNIESTFHQLESLIFDEDEKSRLLAIPPDDLVADSNSNFYSDGVSLMDLDLLPAELRNHSLSYVQRGSDGGISLQYHRLGERFNDELSQVDYYFSQAALYANAREKEILAAYRKVLRTADPQDLEAAETLWVQYQPEDVDFTIGFVEVYMDPLGKRGVLGRRCLFSGSRPVVAWAIGCHSSECCLF